MIKGETYTVHIGNNLDILPTLADNSIDSIVTDPPYELGFMGKKWDSSGIAYNTELWKECLRVLKLGGHLLSFGGTRTWHRVAVAIEDAGFEVRDSIAWMYGSGFPKSLDISKAIDKAAGAERERTPYKGGIASGSGNYGGGGQIHDGTKVGDEAITPEAQQWEGWGTALKPAFEPIVVARKPLIGTVAANVLEHGTGGLNIDGSRIGTGEDRASGGLSGGATDANLYALGMPSRTQRATGGRWPANVILDPYTAELLDEQSGASRFFYVAKASKRDRNEGLENLEAKTAADMTGRKEGSAGLVMKHADGSDKANAYAGTTGSARQNFHPTVKPTALMRYLVKLVTPPGGTVLDPFTGSGSTGKAAILEGFEFVGIELTEDYIPIIEGRLNHAEETINNKEEGLF